MKKKIITFTISCDKLTQITLLMAHGIAFRTLKNIYEDEQESNNDIALLNILSKHIKEEDITKLLKAKRDIECQ